VDVGSSAQVGLFTLGGSNSQSVTVSYPSSLTLDDGSGNDLTFTPDVEGHADTQASASDVASGSQVTLSGTGAYKLWIGGDLGTLSGQTTGTYTSTNEGTDFTITVEYF
jgi:hypothetical protein